jgi:hypothetical protein
VVVRVSRPALAAAAPEPLEEEAERARGMKRHCGPHCTGRKIGIHARTCCRRLRRTSRRPPGFINALLETGIRVHRATREFSAGGKTYPAGSYVVLTNQAFRPHVIDMFEPQDHPDNFAYQGAPPTRPYDNAGWTLAMQMGVEFDRHLEPVTGPFEVIPDWNLTPPAGMVPSAAAPFYVLAPAQIDAFTTVNRLLAAGEEVYRAADGSFVVTGKSTTLAVLRKAAVERGVTVTAATARPATARKLVAPRIGLWDTYGGSIDSGWARWILEQFEFPFERAFAPALDAGNLNAKYDTLVFVDGGIPAAPAAGGAAAGGGRGGGAGAGAGAGATNIPEEFRRSVRQHDGRTHGAAVASVRRAGRHRLSPSAARRRISHATSDCRSKTIWWKTASRSRSRSSTCQAQSSARAWTRPRRRRRVLRPQTNFFFDNSPVWKLGAGARAAGITPLAWFDSPTPLRSGWAWGQEYLRDGVIAVEAKVGKGRVLLYGPEILQRAQPHPTFKLLFNAVY